VSAPKEVAVDSVAYFHFAANTSAGSGGDGATPLFDVRLCGAAADAAPVSGGTPTLLSHANYGDGLHEIAVETTGLDVGAEYAVFCTLTISSVNPAGYVGSFIVRAEASTMYELAASAKANMDIIAGDSRRFISVIDNFVAIPGLLAGSAPTNVQFSDLAGNPITLIGSQYLWLTTYEEWFEGPASPTRRGVFHLESTGFSLDEAYVTQEGETWTNYFWGIVNVVGGNDDQTGDPLPEGILSFDVPAGSYPAKTVRLHIPPLHMWGGPYDMWFSNDTDPAEPLNYFGGSILPPPADPVLAAVSAVPGILAAAHGTASWEGGGSGGAGLTAEQAAWLAMIPIIKRLLLGKPRRV